MTSGLEGQSYDLHYGGAFQPSRGAARLEVRSPATRALLATVPVATSEDVAAAAASAARAFPTWAAVDTGERARLLRALADIVRARIGDLAAIESAVTGRPIREMRAQMSRIPEWLEYFAGIILGLEGESNHVKGGFLTYTTYQPYGVCALLTPWNHPVLILVKKLAAALAAGNCCLIKPSELAPVSPLILADWCREAGLPAGAVNVVTGGGATGAAVVAAPEVKRIDLTGGTATGRRVAAAAAERLVPCTLELGGKAPVIVAEDADIDEAAAGAVFAAFVAAGQTCVSGTRFIVAGPVYDRLVERLSERTKALKVGDPADPTTEMGPVISAAAQERCLEHISAAQKEGARLVAGGGKPGGLPAPCAEGFYVAPTVFADVDPSSRLFSEEVFGPVVGILRYKDEADAIRLANATDFALGGAIWTKDVGRAHRLAHKLEAGVIWINDHHKNDPRSVWGGWGASGYGKENGWDALKSYLKKKSVVTRTEPVFTDWFGGGARYG
ncbi:MAG: aldehyde dehydrogenase family protein [Hyphomicrobiaceae bacterium]